MSFLVFNLIVYLQNVILVGDYLVIGTVFIHHV